MGHTAAVDFVAAGRLCGALSAMANATGITSIRSEYKDLPATANRFNDLPPRLAQPDVTDFFIEISFS